MNTQLFIIFIILNIVNVITQTVKSLATVKCGKVGASLVNALAYGLYTVVLVYTVCDLPLLVKVIVVALCNLVGVFMVKWIEEKIHRDRLWKVEATISSSNTSPCHRGLENAGVPHNFISGVGKWTIFNCYCSTQEDSAKAKKILDHWNAKYFVSESKVL